MFERYTEPARRVIFFARYEASNFGSMTIESEHLLLGLLRENLLHKNEDLIRQFLPNFSEEGLRQEIAGRTSKREKLPTSIDLPLSNECKRILAYTNEEAQHLRHIGPEHLLLGFLRESNCVAAEVLRHSGLSLDFVREHLAGNSTPEIQPGTTQAPPLNNPLATALEIHAFRDSREHLQKAFAAREARRWDLAHSELVLFLESLVEEARARNPEKDTLAPIFEGFDWRLSVRQLQSGLSGREDWDFKMRFVLNLAELLLNRCGVFL